MRYQVVIHIYCLCQYKEAKIKKIIVLMIWSSSKKKQEFKRAWRESKTIHALKSFVRFTYSLSSLHLLVARLRTFIFAHLHNEIIKLNVKIGASERVRGGVEAP